MTDSNIRYTFITGASTGIGYELSKLFAKDKHNLILVSRNKIKLQSVKNELLKYNIDINIKALTQLTKYFLPKIVECKNGGILNVASTAAFCSGPRMAAYYASKAYVLNLTEAIYEEYKDNGIKISCLCPGPVKTSFQGKAGIKKSEAAKKYLMDAEEVAKVCYKDFNKGKLIIIPGMKNRLLVMGNKILPRSISRKIILKTNRK